MTADEATPQRKTADRSSEAARSTADPIDPVRAAALERLPSRIAFLGLGLVGGSIAMALRDAGSNAALAAWTPAGRGPDEAARRGLIAAPARSPEEALDGAELVVLAGPPLAVVAALGGDDGPLAGGLADGATVTDVASTKAAITALAATTTLHFVGGHPLAGREVTGVGGASATLFVDRPWVIVPATTAREIDVDRVAALAAAVGARPIRMTATEHDAAVAAISHLPLVAAAALVEAVALSGAGSEDWPVARALAATGWRDMTRLARGDPEMGAGILETNRAAVAARLRAYRAAIDTWLEALEADGADAAALRSRLEAARDALGTP